MRVFGVGMEPGATLFLVNFKYVLTKDAESFFL